MHLSSLLFHNCEFCNSSIRGEVVKHILPRTYSGVRTSYYHPTCFFVLQQRKMEANLKNPYFNPVKSSEAN